MSRMFCLAICTPILGASMLSQELFGQQDSGPLKSGIDLSFVSKDLQPGDDFYQYMNDGWLKTVEIPPDKSNYGSFSELDDQTIEAVREIIRESASNPNLSGEAKMVGNLFRSYLDLERRNEAKVQPIADLLNRIHQIATKQEWCKVAGELNSVGVGSILGTFIESDARNSEQYAIYVFQGGTSLPDRDYYLVDNERNQEVLHQFRRYIVDMLQFAGFPNPEDSANAILELERKFAEAQWTRVELRNPIKSYNKRTAKEFATSLKSIDWPTLSNEIGLPAEHDLVIGQPSFFEKADAIFSEASLDDLKAFLVFSTIDAVAPMLSEDIEQRHFEFHSQVLSGIPEQKPLERRAIDLCNAMLGMPIGQLYVQRHFPEEAKRRMNELVKNLIVAFEGRIERLEWMGEGTKRQAKEKLASFTPKIGYPDVWKDYSSLQLSPINLVENVRKIREFEHNYELAKLGKPIDRNEWLMTPQTINAYYNPLKNEIVFPAAILQPPFFNLQADDAVNYGAIGAVIGHEISHGFDDSGSQFDGKGNLRNWWTEDDRAEFEKRAKQLINQYSQYKPFDDMNVNGELTIGENIGDLGGVNVAFAAYKLSLGGKPAPVIDGLTGEQRFFMGYAQMWRRKYREAELRKRLLTDPHSPSQYRVNGIVSNMEAFYEIFGVKEGQPMYIAPENRVKIW